MNTQRQPLIRTRSTKALILTSILFFLGCFASTAQIVNTYYEKANIIYKGDMECTVNYSLHKSCSDVLLPSEILGTNHVGVRLGYGINKTFDLKVRYERLMQNNKDMSGDFNYVAISPRIALKEDILSGALDVSSYFSGNTHYEFIGPRLILSFNISNRFDVTTGTKLDLALNREHYSYWGGNLGCGISSDLNKWAIRPEIGATFNVRNVTNIIWNFGLAFVVNFNTCKILH